MSLEYAVLGFLNYQPFTGYALKTMFDSSVRHFWYADQSQIYRTLARLTDEGLAVVEHVAQNDRPDRKPYHITPAGQAAFLEWLRGPFPHQQSKSGPLVHVFFSARLSDAELLAKFETAAEIFRTLLQHYEAVPVTAADSIQKVPSPREQYFWMQTLELGKLTMRAQLEWAEAILANIRDGCIPAQ
ncbi:MAG: PadR family transcriptional regulator [Chloroflexota bacterium]|nr:MAG: PadR family transcriptional regulator [Chloroflexota bacterium]